MQDERKFYSTFRRYLLAGVMMILAFVANVQAQTTAFTYQGKLTDSGSPANGSYDLQIKLYDAVSGGTQQGATLTLTGVAVTGGIFTVTLDFGNCSNCLNGTDRFLEVAVKPTGGGTFTALSPRQQITSTPYAIKSLNATSADGLSVACVNCVTSSQIQSVNGSQVTGTIPVGSVPAGSSNYIQNGTTQQASSNFNISGSGTAAGTLTGSIVNAVNQVNINGLRAFTVNGAYNDGAGVVFTATNSFTGEGAGLNTTPSGTLNSQSGKLNSFYGAGAGQAITTGFRNTFIGYRTGKTITSGNSNTFVGANAGLNNINGSNNTFIGNSAGEVSGLGSDNIYIGSNTGGFSGSNNIFVGGSVGFNNTGNTATNNFNTFVGYGTNFTNNNTQGNTNTLLGAFAKAAPDIVGSTAIGQGALVTQNFSLVLGSINGVNNSSFDTNVGIGTTAPTARLHVVGGGFQNNVLVSDSNTTATTLDLANTSTSGRTWRLQALGNADPARAGNFEVWAVSGPNVLTIQPGGNIGINTTAPIAKLQVHNSTADQHLYLSDAAPSLALGNNTVRSSATMNGLFALSTAASHFGVEAGSVTVAAYGNSRGNIYINSNYSGTGLTHVILQPLGGNVGVGTTSPADRLHVFGDVRVGTAGTNGCLKNSNGGTILGTCSSDARFKRDVVPFSGLLDRVARLQPVTFYWRAEDFPGRGFGRAQESGLIAQEVEKILPELVTTDEQGFKAVNYSKLPLLSIQAIKELKAENDSLKAKVDTLTMKAEQFDALKKLVCADHPDADICKQYK